MKHIQVTKTGWFSAEHNTVRQYAIWEDRTYHGSVFGTDAEQSDDKVRILSDETIVAIIDDAQVIE